MKKATPKPRGQNGGSRPGAGRKKGGKNVRTMERELREDMLRDKLRKKLEPIVDAQIANAKGIKYLVVRERKGGKFLRVTETMAKAKLGKGEEIVEIWEKDPSVQAFSELLNRAYGKPKEAKQEVDVSGDLVLRWKTNE